MEIRRYARSSQTVRDAAKAPREARVKAAAVLAGRQVLSIIS